MVYRECFVPGKGERELAGNENNESIEAMVFYPFPPFDQMRP